MAKCQRCGKRGLFFKVNSDGICKDCVRLVDIEGQVKETESLLEFLNEQLSDREKLYDETVKQAKEDALQHIERELLEKKELISQQDDQINTQKSTLEDIQEKIEKGEKAVTSAANKAAKLRTLFKSIQYEIRKFEEAGDTGHIDASAELEAEIDSLLQPTVELNLNCLNIRELRKRYKQNEKNIEELLQTYEGRYTTKANATIYKLMVIALRAELQNILYNIKFGDLDEAIDNVKSVTAKYLQIATDGNQSIAPTMKKFIGQLEYLFIEAVNIEYEYYVQKERIKEEQRALREQMRQEAEERKLLEQQQKQIEKEAAKYQTEIASLSEQLKEDVSEDKATAIQDRIVEINVLLESVEEKKDEIVKLQHGKAGHVYVISNLGSFGDNVFKVGMTRRLDPNDRINELGDASVPFPFDIHSLIFSDDAVALERQLHDILHNQRINKVNLRKEFFKVSLNELEKIVFDIDPSAEFNRTMLAEQYRQSLSFDDIRSVCIDEDELAMANDA